jgi:serine/threonine protein kinase
MANPQIEIVITNDGTEVVRRPLSNGEYVIGQDKAADLLLDLPQVSPKHARLTIDDDAIFIEDLGSDAGTFINGRPATDNTRIWPSQKVRIGSATLEAHVVGKDPAASTIGDAVPSEVVVERTYEIEKVLTREEEGPVLDTHDSAIRRDLAMKVMRSGATEAEVARFIEEAQITGQLEHPNIPPVHELGTDAKGRPYYTMKVMRGITLGKVLELLHDRQSDAIYKYPLLTLLGILIKACDAVAFAHSKGMIHRDLKPDSISVGDFGEVLVMDWGSAVVLDPNGAAASTPRTNICLTATCPQYISPEQARGELSTLDVRTDIYALGAILYHILSLRAPINESDPATALKLIGEGRTDRMDLGAKLPHLPRERVPDPLAAIVTKAMALQPTGRYQRVEGLQADLLAYQNAVITEAEKVGPVKQFFFVVNRYKLVSLVSAIVVGVSLFFGITSVITAWRAVKRAASDRAIANNLHSKAADFLKLAEHQSDTQHFEEALTSLDAAIAVDPNPPRPYWERAWALLALERWDDAAKALQAAQGHGPVGTDPKRVLDSIPGLKRIAKDPQRWKSEPMNEVFRYLESSGASGPAFSIAAKLQENAEGRRKLVEQRLLTVLGRDKFAATTGPGGQVILSVAGQPLRSLDVVRGLPIDSLDASGTAITDLEPLRGLRLQSLSVANTKVSSLNVLQGMPLRKLVLDNTPVNNIDALKGAPIETLSLEGTKVYIFQVIKEMPIRSLNLRNTVITNLNVLQGVQVEKLNLAGSLIKDLNQLQNSPLKELDVRRCKNLTDMRAVLTMPNLEKFGCDTMPKDLSALRQSKTLQTIEADAAPGEGSQGARPAAQFWADFDAKAK